MPVKGDWFVYIYTSILNQLGKSDPFQRSICANYACLTFFRYYTREKNLI
jgi:hypothetical protein